MRKAWRVRKQPVLRPPAILSVLTAKGKIMRILVDVDEAAERFEELIELVVRGDEVLICRAGKPVAEMTANPKATSKPGELRALMDKRRATVPAGATSNHDDFYDGHGLPK